MKFTTLKKFFILIIFVGIIIFITEKNKTDKFSTSNFQGNIKILTGTIADHQTLLEDAALVIENNKIVWIGKKDDLLIDKGTEIKTNGFIYPGLIDSHNHPTYNFLPRWTPPEKFTNRYQWSRTRSYKDALEPRKALVKDKTTYINITKYAEIKELISGSTMIQGCPKRKGLDTLIRNLESYNGLKEDTISTSIFPLQPREKKRAKNIILSFEKHKTTHHIIHLGEGTDEESKNEIYELQEIGLTRPGVVVIHGTAFTEKEFNIMKENNMPLVWSPKSNMELYQDTTKVDLAHKLGLKICLAPDWSVTGTDNMLYELQYAYKVNKELFNNYFSKKQLFEMATIVPAKELGFEEYIGSLELGKRADIFVSDKLLNDPFENIFNISLKNINLVLVDGNPLYGTVENMEKLGKKGDYELLTVENTVKAIDTTEDNPDIPLSDMRLKEIIKDIKSKYENLAPLAENVYLK